MVIHFCLIVGRFGQIDANFYRDNSLGGASDLHVGRFFKHLAHRRQFFGRFGQTFAKAVQLAKQVGGRVKAVAWYFQVRHIVVLLLPAGFVKVAQCGFTHGLFYGLPFTLGAELNFVVRPNGGRSADFVRFLHKQCRLDTANI